MLFLIQDKGGQKEKVTWPLSNPDNVSRKRGTAKGDFLGEAAFAGGCVSVR
jgi:hypothetical protein